MKEHEAAKQRRPSFQQWQTGPFLAEVITRASSHSSAWLRDTLIVQLTSPALKYQNIGSNLQTGVETL
jgi:hypothetical protein